MESTHVSLDEVRLLVGERQRYDGWLSALEQRRQDTPPRVFAKVHDDYEARRAEVMARLQVHVAGLERLAHELAAQAEQLAGRSAALEEERLEAHLRTAVGEIDTHRWEALQQELEGRLAEVARERVVLAGQLDEVGGLLARARGESHKVASEPAWLAEAPSARPSAPAALALPAVTPPPTAVGPDTAPAMAAVAPPPPVLPPVLPPVSQPTAAPAQPSLDDEVERALASLEPLAPPVAPVAPAVPAQADLLDAEPATAYEPREEPLPAAPEPAAAHEAAAFDDMAFVRSIVEPVATDTRKTLRCGECGTFNLPTEWYCEQCGGELAAE